MLLLNANCDCFICISCYAPHANTSLIISKIRREKCVWYFVVVGFFPSSPSPRRPPLLCYSTTSHFCFLLFFFWIYLVSSSPSELLRIVLYCELRLRNIRKKLPTANIVRRWRWNMPWYNASRSALRSSTISTWDVIDDWWLIERLLAFGFVEPTMGAPAPPPPPPLTPITPTRPVFGCGLGR